MIITNPPKAFIALVALVCLTLLRALDRIDQASFNALAGWIIGYIVGNGIAAKSGTPVQPIIGKGKDA